jgi:hypothetical protein
MRLRPIHLLALLLSLAACALPALAATPSQTPSLAPASRILHTFDFEETSLGNFESTPMFWSKVVDRGFPAFASGRFDHDTYRSNNTSFRLDIDSGSAAYLYNAPPERRIPINPNADYYIIGFAKTTPLAHARAQITAWFADDQGNLLQESQQHSEPFASTAGEGAADWHVLHLFMPGPRPHSPEAARAKSLVLQVALLQPQQLAATGEKQESPLGRFQLYQQDIKGSAWFDDITVFQLPRISVQVPESITANIFNPGQPIAIDLTVADIAHADTQSIRAGLAASLKITDPDGLLFATDHWQAVSTSDEPWIHHYTHAPLPPGLYTATLDVADSSTGALIARRETHFASLAPLPVVHTDAGTERTAPEFGITATDWPTIAWTELPTILHDLNVGLVQLSAWRRDMSEDSLRLRDPSLDALLNALQHGDVHTIASLAELPSVLNAKIADTHPGSASQDSLLALQDADPTLWRPYASFMLARYSTLVDRWELGSPAAPFSGSVGSSQPLSSLLNASADPYPKLYTQIYTQLGSLLAAPRLIIPWNALFDFSDKLYPNATLDLRIPALVKPSQIPSYIHDFKVASGGDKVDLYVHIDPLDSDTYSPSDYTSDFAQRILYARSANPTATLTDIPFTRTNSLTSAGAHTEPQPLLVTYRTLVRMLGNSTYRREIPLGTGIHAFLFTNETGGILALWSDGAAGAQVPLDLPLGTDPRAVELSGMIRPLAVDPKTRLTHLTLTDAPLLLDHLDAHLLELRATFAFGNTVFPAGAGYLRTDVELANPYPNPLSATMHMTPPAGWSIDPPIFPVVIAPGATFKQPVIVRYPYTESAGPKTMGAKLTSDSADEGPSVGSASATAGSLGPLNLSVPISVSSDIVETECFARILPNGDLVVQQMITNISSSPINAEAYALVPGFARQQRFVLDLPPGQSTIKRFLFPMSTYVDFTAKTTPATMAATLTGKVASVGLRQNDGKTLITKTIPLE